ncbi:MAG: hypothetical protein ACK55Z_15380, partial [bacterium]
LLGPNSIHSLQAITCHTPSNLFRPLHSHTSSNLFRPSHAILHFISSGQSRAILHPFRPSRAKLHPK